MQIHIQLAGVALGPYSERQVREYLTDGLLSPGDPARLEGSDQWEPVTGLLAKLPPAEPAPASKPVPTPQVEPEAEASPAKTLEPAPSPAKSKPDEPRQGAPLVVKSLLKKAAIVGQKSGAAPRTTSLEPAPSGAKIIPFATTKAVPRKTEPPPAPSPAQLNAPPPHAPSLDFPENNPQIGNIFPAPEKLVRSIEPPEPSISTTPSAVPNDPTATIRAVARKPGSEPKPRPDSPPLLPGTESGPKVSGPIVTKPEVKAEVKSEPLPTIATAKTDTPPAVQPKETAKPVPANPNPATPLPTPTIKVNPRKTTNKPQSNPLIQLASAVPTSPPKPLGSIKVEPPRGTPPKEVLLTSDESWVQPAAPPPTGWNFWRRFLPKPRPPIPGIDTPAQKLRRLILFVILLVVVLLVSGAIYAVTAYSAADAVLKALSSGSEEQLQSTIDFIAVRHSLIEQLDARVAAAAGADAKKFAASQPLTTMIERSINLYVTPPAISSLVKTGRFDNDAKDLVISVDQALTLLQTLNSEPVKSQGFAGPGEFVIDLDVARLYLVCRNLDWKLDHIELKPDLQLPAPTAASSPSATNTASGTPSPSPAVETLLRDGNDEFQKKDWDGAIKDFDQALAVNPKEEVAYNNRGFAKLSKGDADGAIADYTQAISLDPKLASAYYSRGNAKIAKNDLDGALADYSQALSLDPKLTGAYYSRGNARTTRNDYGGAVSDYTMVISLDPTQANAYSNRGFARQAKNDLDGAIADYTQALAIDPKIAIAYYNRGLARQAKDDLDNAILDYNQALDLDPKMSGTYYNRGNAKNTKHDYDGAIADYDQALSLDPKIALAYCNRGLAKQAKNDLAGALADYTQALSVDPSIAVAYYNRGLIKEQTDDLDGAIADSSRAIDLDGKEAQAYYNRGFAKLAKGSLPGASEDLLKFCELAPRDHFTDHARLYLWLVGKAQNNASANSDLADAMRSEWNSASDDLVTLIAGFLLDRASEADLIAAAASSDVKKDPAQHCEAWYFAGMKRLLAGDRTTAIDYFHKCLATDKKDFCEYILAKGELAALDPPSKK